MDRPKNVDIMKLPKTSTYLTIFILHFSKMIQAENKCFTIRSKSKNNIALLSINRFQSRVQELRSSQQELLHQNFKRLMIPFIYIWASIANLQ